ncbi:MAG TPA: glycosyltransferase family 39 protein [Candidatus Acidoferrales bacterium]|nr:glycosyltransferase family 39 protein [Candidatus Acidoferrales bacterium]
MPGDESYGGTGTKLSASSARDTLTSGEAIVAYLAFIKLLLHLATANVYGLFVDELYFLACGEHLSWGYVDMPPLTALQAWLARSLFGDSMLAVRLFPALAGAGLVLLTGAITRELGGRRFAQGLATLAVLVAPGYLLVGSYLSMNSIEPLLWMGCVLVLIRIIRSGNVKLWLWFGVLTGLGIENKDTMLLFASALSAGLLLSPERRTMANRWFVAGALIAFLIFLPNLMWMIQHNFPHLELLANIRRNERNVSLSPLQFFGQQILAMQPLAFPIWLCGLCTLLLGRNGKPYRALGWAYLLTLGALLAMHGRFYYLMPIYPMLFAAGAVAMESWFRARHWSWAPRAYATLVVVTGTFFAPIAMPILPPDTLVRYTELLGVSQPALEHRQSSALPQLFADRFGWPEMVATVAMVYKNLPPDEREKTAIFGTDYGEAGAIDFYGQQLGLPKAISGHLTYWYWGPGPYTGESVIVLGAHNRDNLEKYFTSVEEVASVGHRFAMASQHFPVYLCRGPRGRTLQEIWPELKNWN